MTVENFSSLSEKNECADSKYDVDYDDDDSDNSKTGTEFTM